MSREGIEPPTFACFAIAGGIRAHYLAPAMKAPKPERLVQPRPPFSTVHSLPGQIRVQPIGQPPLLDIRLVGRLLRPRSGCSATHLLALQLFRPHTSPRLSPNRGDNLRAHPSPNSTFNRCQRSGRWFWPPGRLRRSQWYSAVSSPSALSTCLGKPPVVLPPPNDLFVSKRQRTEQSTSVPRPNSPAGSVPHHRQVARVISPPTPSSQQQHPPTVTIHPSTHPPIHPYVSIGKRKDRPRNSVPSESSPLEQHHAVSGRRREEGDADGGPPGGFILVPFQSHHAGIPQGAAKARESFRKDPLGGSSDARRVIVMVNQGGPQPVDNCLGNVIVHFLTWSHSL